MGEDHAGVHRHGAVRGRRGLPRDAEESARPEQRSAGSLGGAPDTRSRARTIAARSEKAAAYQDTRDLMKALHVTAPGGLDRIEVVEAPNPVPGLGDVLIRMRAVSLNYRDLLMVQGRYARADFAFPITPFSDGCGIVEAVGPGVTRVQPGDRVAPMFFQKWLAGAAT